MKSLVQYIKESGNAVTSNPVPAYITPLVYKEIEDKIHAADDTIKLVPLGSMGKKKDDQFNGDIDVAISITDPEKLLGLIGDVFPKCEVNPKTAPNIISIGYPYNKEGKSGVAQVDFMMTDNIDWTKWRFSSPDFRKGESKYKAAPKVFLLQYLVSAIPVADARDEYFDDGKTVKRHWRYAFNQEGVFKQLEDYTGKKGPLKNPKKLKEFEKLVTNDPVNVMRFIFGDKYDEKDFVSVEALWKAAHSSKWPWGKDALAKAEERWYKEYLTNPHTAVPVDPDEFKPQIYKPE